ncbi:hypothetical protein CGLO_05900 [Colletotrichum gloeosporioides Cg-14]|uniref:Uncharacterized protein n=1 Tax=Colletotrichum gloeosporioides (strain Cg-14) TaxID=1237896 RepID=T0KFS9_COLGC|nr:hypothetical protein CGLO_05900 [Colletotrichum gloeosporioides Cg-14]
MSTYFTRSVTTSVFVLSAIILMINDPTT